MNRSTFIVLTTLFFMIIATSASLACNQQLCSGVVPYCRLSGHCDCDVESCSCCQICFACLGDMYNECCSCFDLCRIDDSQPNSLLQESQIGDLDPMPSLFDSLTNTDDSNYWTIYKFPVDEDLPVFDAKVNLHFKEDVVLTTGSRVDVVKTMRKSGPSKCTVAYLPKCMSSNKCKNTCHSMGASSYRWFHDGCCQCAGETCQKYGIDENRCKNCPEADETVHSNADASILHGDLKFSY